MTNPPDALFILLPSVHPVHPERPKVEFRRRVASLRKLYVQVLIGIAAGILLGFARPEWGLAVKPLGDAFVALLRMLLAPIIFCSVVHGIASIRDISRLGRLGIRALIYFEVVSTI